MKNNTGSRAWRHLRWSAALALGVLAGCGGGRDEDPALQATAPLPAPQARTGPQAPRFPESLRGLEHTVVPPTPGGPWRADGGYQIDPNDRQAVLLFYRTVFAASSAVADEWSGDLATCAAGAISAAYQAAVLRRVNWFRGMAGVPANVQFDATFSAKAQQAALMMAANGTLNHYPPASWRCYTADGAEAASHSNLSLGRIAVEGVTDGFMGDGGSNNAAVGHRRWVLYPQTRFMGVGSVNGSTRANTLWVMDGNGGAPRPPVRDDYVAWPPRGFVPYTTVWPRWSLSYPGADFSGASVAMSENGVPIATRLEPLTNGFGENTLVWFPGSYADGMRWSRPAADTVYDVTVSNVRVGGAARTFSWRTVVFDPDQESAADATTVAGGGLAVAGEAASYSVAAATAASAFQWRSLVTAPYALDDGAEAGLVNFVAGVSPGYPVVAGDVKASGAASFHLAHVQYADQVLQLRQPLVPGPTSILEFGSRLGLSSPSQLATVEASTDDGASWTTLYSQAGQQTGTTSSFGETAFSTKSVSLAAYADRVLLLRFRYAVLPGSFYPQSSTGIGWYIDDIRLQRVRALAATGAAAEALPGFTLLTSQPAEIYLQGRAGMYGFYAGWGPLKKVSVVEPTAAADCLFDWAQVQYAGLFTTGPRSLLVAPYYFRYYPPSDMYLGVSSADNHVYYQAGGQLHDAGARAAWFESAGCFNAGLPAL